MIDPLTSFGLVGNPLKMYNNKCHQLWQLGGSKSFNLSRWTYIGAEMTAVSRGGNLLPWWKWGYIFLRKVKILDVHIWHGTHVAINNPFWLCPLHVIWKLRILLLRFAFACVLCVIKLKIIVAARRQRHFCVDIIIKVYANITYNKLRVTLN